MSPRLLALLGIAAAIEALAFFLLRDPQASGMQGYRLIHLAEMLALIALVLVESRGRGRIVRLVLAGLLLSFAGDIVNSYLIDLTHILKPQTLLSIPPFVAAHLCYIAAFVILTRTASARSLPWAPLVLAWPVLALGLWWLVIDHNAPPLLLKLSVGYAFVVMLMGMMALLLGARLGRAAWMPALGGLIFVVSDGILGSYLLDGPQRPVLASQVIWATYFLAQALISRAPVLENVVRPMHSLPTEQTR
jgi:uncharacterized membrane protein YhhN